MARPSIEELMRVPAEEHDLEWLHTSLQWAVELEFATIPVYLSGMWSIEEQSGEVYNLIDSVVMEEMLHLGLVCNMLTAIGRTPQFKAPTYPGGLPGGVRPGLEVYLGGLNDASVEMYMQIEMPEDPLARLEETFPTIGAFYDAISAAFTALAPPLSTDGQLQAGVSVPDPDQPELPNPPQIFEPLNALASLDDVQKAIATIKDQGEGTSLSPDAPQFDNGELAHYYRFGEILNRKKLIKVDGSFKYSGDDVPFPDCYPVARVPRGGYPGVPAVQEFDARYSRLIGQLQAAWDGTSGLGPAFRTMGGLGSAASEIVTMPRPDGSGNYGPDFVPSNAATGTPPGTPPASTGTGSTATAASFKTDILPLFTSMDVEHMSDFGVSLDDYGYMSKPSNASDVFNTVSSGLMPPGDSGEERWSPEKVALFKAWVDGGYQP
jgi:hypothetical protein